MSRLRKIHTDLEEYYEEVSEYPYSDRIWKALQNLETAIAEEKDFSLGDFRQDQIDEWKENGAISERNETD